MGWFDEQIEYRKKHERELLEGTFENIARSVTGRRVSSLNQAQADVSDAVSSLLKYLGVKEQEVPAGINGLEDRLDFLLSSTGILYREIELKPGWQKDASGAMISSIRETGQVIALLPSEIGTYEYTDAASGEKRRVTAHEAKKISSDALVFYRPLPMRALKVRDLVRYMSSCLTTRDIAGFGLAALITRTTRSSMLDVLRQDYMTTAKAKGASRRRVIYRHGLRNALIPIVTAIGMQFSLVMTGSALAEKVFSWPGIGLLVADSITKRDIPMVTGAIILCCILMALINLLVDIIYAYCDPRIKARYSRKG